MAIPQELTMPNFSGTYVINKQISDDLDPLFVLQGLSWFVRRTIGFATVTTRINHYSKDGVAHLDLTSSALGLPKTFDNRVLDFELRFRQDRIFGNMKIKSRVINIAAYEMIIEGGTEKDAEFLMSSFVDESAIQAYGEGAERYKWRIEQSWGIEEVGGERRVTQRMVARKGDEVLRLRIVYDYLGPAE
ncbi:hypothetical protein DV737_g2208, partial [Chaetothyriales sp. CBS 132003]